MAQQTAVEQLVNYMIENFHLTDEALEKFEQAKQMEREQHEDTWDAGMSEGIGTTIGSIDYDGEFINYYTKTYGK